MREHRWQRGATRTGPVLTRRTVRAGFALAAATFAGVVAGQERTPEPPPESAYGAPVNLYGPDADPYAWPQGETEIQPWHVRGRVWLMAGGASNITVHVGDQGAFVIDTGTREMASAVLPYIQQLAREHASDAREIRMVVNTNGRPDHIGGNQIIRESGRQVSGGEQARVRDGFGTPGAEVFAHERVLERLVTEGVDPELWPTDSAGFDNDSRRFNGEAVQIHRVRSANTEGQLILVFRESDVLIVGDVVDMTRYPVIDAARGGTIDGLLVALNQVIDLAVPGRQADGGTVIVPGHGRLADQADVVLYRNMLTVIRNVVQYYKGNGMTLDEVLALEVTQAYDQRWGAESEPWTTRDFVTAVYETLPADGPVYFSIENVNVLPDGREL